MNQGRRYYKGSASRFFQWITRRVVVIEGTSPERAMRRRPLILVVDIDDDIGEVLGRSVIVGFDNVKEAVIDYGMERPEDADVNAMLAGLKLYRELRERGLDPEIAVVGGHRVDFVEAQRNIKKRVGEIVEGLGAVPEFYIVSDGEDEFVISQLLHEYGVVAGFYRVIVEQHLGIEGGYLLVLRYIKKAVEDPRYSKYVVGIPGAAIALLGLTALFNVANLALELLALLIGFAMVIVGFNLEKPLERWLNNMSRSLVEKPHFYAVGLLVFTLFLASSIYAGYSSYEKYGYSEKTLVDVLRVSMPLLGAGIVSYILVSRVFTKASMGDLNLFHEAAGIIVTIAVTVALYNMGVYLKSAMATGASSEITLRAFIDSGFIQAIIIGTGLAALIELAKRILDMRRAS